MTWTVVLIIVLVFAMMLGPLLLLKPNRHQQQLAALRLEAAQRGLRVELQKILGRTVAAYELRWPRDERQKFGGEEWALEKQTYTHEIHMAGVWQWRGQHRAPANLVPLLEESLQALPSTVVAIEATRLGLRAYWTEAGGRAEYARVLAWLERYAQIMSPYMHRSTD